MKVQKDILRKRKKTMYGNARDNCTKVHDSLGLRVERGYSTPGPVSTRTNQKRIHLSILFIYSLYDLYTR